MKHHRLLLQIILMKLRNTQKLIFCPCHDQSTAESLKTHLLDIYSLITNDITKIAYRILTLILMRQVPHWIQYYWSCRTLQKPMRGWQSSKISFDAYQFTWPRKSWVCLTCLHCTMLYVLVPTGVFWWKKFDMNLEWTNNWGRKSCWCR